MSLASGVGSSSDEVVTLADVVQRLKAIEDIVRPLQPIADALNALEDTVRDQGQQQVALNLALTRMEKQILDQQALNQSAQDLGQNRSAQDLGQNWAALNQGRAGAEDGDDGRDFLPTAHKLEFPKFDGARDTSRYASNSSTSRLSSTKKISTKQ
ncbi:hypothetical protein GUJ93_ZPchr0001g29344 [Zizania palustris]|uniref:Uncharacterized protein n=1 Tax=Zizania palustris TaxID=103762 RepID=A0A8J5RZD5_ZIZPA|nr:hypothetical protein GUJ93_ZPchr0001g29344 [Zizania palustris]